MYIVRTRKRAWERRGSAYTFPLFRLFVRPSGTDSVNPSSSSSSSTVCWISQSGVNVTARNLRFQKRRQRYISPFPLKTPRNKTWLLWHVCAFKSAVRQSPRSSSNPSPPQPHRLLALIPAKKKKKRRKPFRKIAP